jgi:hypothetical protein
MLAWARRSTFCCTPPGAGVPGAGEDDEYLRQLRRAWQDSLKASFLELPKLPLLSPSVRLVDA